MALGIEHLVGHGGVVDRTLEGCGGVADRTR